MRLRAHAPVQLAFRGLALGLVVLGAAACSGARVSSDPRVSTTNVTSAAVPLGGDDPPETVEAQGDDPDDLRITRAIRDALHADETLSPGARNTRVLTQNRHVVLRGVAANEHEREVAESIARRFAVDVDDEITVSK